MKKLIMLVVIILSGYGCYVAATEGINANVGNFEINIPSFQKVKNENEEMKTNLNKLEQMNKIDTQTAFSGVTAQVQNYETQKQEYDLLALTASEEDIAEANKVEKYLLDFLWMRIGKYASDNDIKWKMDYNDIGTLTFDITGSYISVINFIYDLENDKDLGFIIDEIIIEGGSSSTVVKANFIVEGINVITAPEE